MNTNQSRDELFDRHLRGELTDVEKALVAELLDSDAAARQQFVKFAQWDTEISETIREHAGTPHNKDILPSGKGTSREPQFEKNFRFLSSLHYLRLRFFLMLLSGLLYQADEHVFCSG